jgi:dTDP-4-dehydrorhamnose reductase
MRILLTGVSGQLGGVLRACLRDHDVIAPDRRAFDLERGAAIAPYVRALRPQLVVNCAAYTAVDQAETDCARAEAINATAPGLIAGAAREMGAGLVHFSTDYVFDGTARRPYREADPCAPLNAYGRSKLQGERNIAASGVPHLIIRTSWLYGASGRNFLTTMLRIGRERPELRVVDDQRGAPTSVDSLAATVAAIVGQMGDDPLPFLRAHGGILHAACDGETTWFGFACAIFAEARARGLPLAVQSVEPIDTAQYPTAARRPAYSVFDLGRLRTEFAVTPPPWREALARVMDQVVA